MYKVTLIPGDGIGPEVTSAMVKVVEASGADIDWEIVEAGEALIEKYNTAIPDYVIDSIKKNKISYCSSTSLKVFKNNPSLSFIIFAL